MYSAVFHDDCHPFNALCANTDVVRDPDELKESDAALIIWGGADINPAYYKHPMHSTTYPGGARDRVEWTLMQRAIEKGITIIGVCRGAQMGCAAAGGFLIQDVAGHGGMHEVTTYDGRHLQVNSIHHQMMVPDKAVHQLVAWSTHHRSIRGGVPYYGYMDDKQFVPPEDWKEPEYVWFPEQRIHAIQWHPEMMNAEALPTQFILNFITEKENERKRSIFPVCGC